MQNANHVHALAGSSVEEEIVLKIGDRQYPVVSLDSVDEIRTMRACLLSPREARDTIHFRSAPSAPVVRGWRPAVRVSKRRNSLTRCAPWPKVIRFPEPHPSEGLDRPPMPTGMTDETWTMEVLLSDRVPRAFHAQLDQ